MRVPLVGLAYKALRSMPASPDAPQLPKLYTADRTSNDNAGLRAEVCGGRARLEPRKDFGSLDAAQPPELIHRRTSAGNDNTGLLFRMG